MGFFCFFDFLLFFLVDFVACLCSEMIGQNIFVLKFSGIDSGSAQ